MADRNNPAQFFFPTETELRFTLAFNITIYYIVGYLEKMTRPGLQIRVRN